MRPLELLDVLGMIERLAGELCVHCCHGHFSRKSRSAQSTVRPTKNEPFRRVRTFWGGSTENYVIAARRAKIFADIGTLRPQKSIFPHPNPIVAQLFPVP